MSILKTSQGKPTMHTLKRQQGYSLIEVLVSVVVLAVGFLGMTGLQARSLQSSQNSVLRTQAAFLSYDILEKMRGNPTANTAAAYAGKNGITEATNCLTTSCTTDQLAAFDVLSWKCTINSIFCKDSVNNNLISTTSELPNGKGTISASNGKVTIAIEWSEERSSNPTARQSFVLETTL
ncbi:MAG: type IV pilus modification protein PilV [Marinagarivorans sp.]|nr:type IV pilus modification protein PilV [Marinagarivorans sp.]